MKLCSAKGKVLEQLKTEKSIDFKFLVIRNGLNGDTVFITPVVFKLKENIIIQK
jgi:hypothetical protein